MDTSQVENAGPRAEQIATQIVSGVERTLFGQGVGIAQQPLVATEQAHMRHSTSLGR